MAVVLSGSSVQAQQPGQDRPIPRELFAQLRRDLSDDPVFADERELQATVRVADRMDLDGDGSDEYVLGTTGVHCGATGNCAFWVYRREAGDWRRIHSAYGFGVEALSTRTNGFVDVASTSRTSANETSRETYAFNGEEYVWRENVALRAVAADEWTQVFRLWTTFPESGSEEPRTLTLDPIATGRATVAATYTVCPAERATAGELCGTPQLILTAADDNPRWRPDQRVCLRLSYVRVSGEDKIPAGELCGVVGRDAALTVDVDRRQLAALLSGISVELRGSGLALNLTYDDGALAGLLQFTFMVFVFNGIDPFQQIVR